MLNGYPPEYAHEENKKPPNAKTAKDKNNFFITFSFKLTTVKLQEIIIHCSQNLTFNYSGGLFSSSR